MHIVLLFLLSFYYNTSTIYCHITPHTHPQGCAGGVSLLIPPLALGEGEKLRRSWGRRWKGMYAKRLLKIGYTVIHGYIYHPINMTTQIELGKWLCTCFHCCRGFSSKMRRSIRCRRSFLGRAFVSSSQSFVKRWTWQKLHLDSLDLVGLSIGFS